MSENSKAIVELSSGHLAQLEALLKINQLPFEDCGEHIENFIGIPVKQKLVAIGGFEFCSQVGLLRSLTVDSQWRGQGLAGMIIERLHENAAKLGIQKLYLLTETAQTYFLSKGYHNCDRDELPFEIKNTRQFQSLCPASARSMMIRLAEESS